MYRNLADNISIQNIEKEILEFWKKENIFQKSIDFRSDNKIFTFYEGPPTANGMPGIHHVISRTVKDMVCRYKTMSGYKVYRKAGWDTHGLPVEVEVEKKLGLTSKDEITKLGAVKFNNACKDSIFTYLKQWEELTDRMGYWINLDDAYVTFHNEYIESVWWALKRFYDEGKIYKGFKIQPYCPVCESPLSSHEVAQGYQDIKEPSIYIKFKINDNRYKDFEFLVWTTTPWTLISNVSLCVNPEAEYVLVKTEKDNFILAKERLGCIKEEYQIVGTVIGNELENISYEPLFNFFSFDEKAYYVTTGNFVTMEDGSGIVHIAPAFGEDDYQIGLKYKLPLVQAVLTNGKFKEQTGKYANQNFKEADPEIIQDLKERGRLYKKEMFTHSYPHCWRHKVPLMYYATDSWFIQTTSFKERMIELNNTINWTPEEFGTGRFGNWLEENKDWALSRNRFWGTPLPIWSCDDINGNKRYVCIGSIEELKEKSSNFDEVYKEQIDLHRPYIDEIKMKSEDGTEMNREPVVIDCWFDSGSMPFAQYHYPFENKEFFKKHYPGDFIAEGIDQTRGWFYSLHAIGTFLFDKPAYKNLIVNGLILDKNAKKMSKTAGNVVNPFEIMEKFGADILRWYLVASSPVWKSKLFNENDLVDIKNKFFDTLINTFKFFIIYANISNFVNEETEKIIENKRVEIDKWLISKLNTVKKEYFYLMDKYEITKAARIVYDFTIDELSNWYVRRNRKRFRNPSNNFDKLSAYQTLYEVLIEILKLIAPLAPFISEKLYLELTNDNGSIHLSEFSNYCESNIDIQLEEQMNLAQRIVYLVRAVRVKNNLKVRQPLRQLLIPVFSESKKKQLLKVKDIILDEINVKELKVIDSDSGIIKKKTKPNFKSIGPKFGKEVKKVQNIIINFSDNEIKTLEVNKEIIKDNFKIDINDVEILTENIDGWIIESDGEITIALDTKLDKDLINEGFIREFINRVQNYRKSNDFNVDDKINIMIRTDKELSEVLIKNFKKYSLEVSCEKIEIADNSFSGFTKTDINGIELEFQIEKI